MTRSSPLTTLRSFTDARAFFGAALLALANFIIVGAWSFQLLGGLAPCPLCLDQRVPWYLAIFIGSALTYGSFNGWSRQVIVVLFAVAAVLMLWAAYEGLFHAGVEYKIWKGPPTCTTGNVAIDPTLDLEQLGRTKVPMCDVAPWSLFGISLAGFNFLFSILGLGLALLGLARAAKE